MIHGHYTKCLPIMNLANDILRKDFPKASLVESFSK